MAQKCHHGRQLRRILTCHGAREQHGDGTFGRIKDQRGGRGRPVAGAQDIGGPDIARPNLPQVAKPEEAGDQQTKGDRPQQIGRDRNGDQQRGGCGEMGHG